MKKLWIAMLMFSGTLSAQDSSKPNIILIVADDLGIGDLGVYGQKKIRTPNIDALAKNGMRFNQFYAGTSVCAPSRASLLTGLNTGHTAIRGNKEMQPEGQFPLPEQSFTIAELLRNAGYRTGDFGKWGLGPVGSTGDPLKQGFDVFYGYNCQRQSHNYYPDHLWSQDIKVNLPENTFTTFKTYAPQLIQEQALKFIDNSKNKPFFLYLSYTLPHAALQVEADPAFEQYKQAFKEKPVPVQTSWNGQGYAPQEFPHAAYATMVHKLDEYVGQVVAAVKNKGLENNTIIIFTSDNGPHKEGGNDPDFFKSNMGFRGYKRDLYEGGIRVPMIVSWPEHIKRNRVSEHIAAFWDILPTFAELTQQKITTNTDGLSFVSELFGKRQEIHEQLYWEFHENGGRQALRMDQWKGYRENVIKDEFAPIELYDLRNDPGEKKNVARKFPGIVSRMREVMLLQHVESDDFPLMRYE
ncbi:MAG: arylsulfatase [Flavitalea sp.]